MILSAYRFADGIAIDPDAIATAADVVRAGGLIGLPTETVYGLGADASNPAAVAQIFTAKGRPADHPLIVHVAAFDGGMGGIAHYSRQVPAFARQLISAFWPGPLTLILTRQDGVGGAAAGGQDSIGLRCPDHPVAQALLAALRKPAGSESVVWGVAAPSANQFGRVSPTTAAHVQGEFGDDLLILDGGPCEVGIESTIIDCTRGVPVLLRPGSITAAQVEAACGRKLLSKDDLLAEDAPAPRASGTLESHYAPRATVRLMDAKALQAALDLLGSAQAPDRRPTIALYHRSPLKLNTPLVSAHRMPSDAAVAAHELFSKLREMDAQGVKLIWVEAPPEALEWDGVRDRLTRASA